LSVSPAVNALHVNVLIKAPTIQLVPPSLAVIAALITYKKSLHYAVAQLENKAYQGHSYVQLRTIGWPEVKVESASLGHGLTISYTETMSQDYIRRHGLVWVSELACHPLCAFLGRICQGNLSSFEWLEKIEKKHREWLETIPTV